jgi:hypothetical protein
MSPARGSMVPHMRAVGSMEQHAAKGGRAELKPATRIDVVEQRAGKMKPPRKPASTVMEMATSLAKATATRILHKQSGRAISSGIPVVSPRVEEADTLHAGMPCTLASISCKKNSRQGVCCPDAAAVGSRHMSLLTPSIIAMQPK